jgi:hypothetical protein
VLTSIARRLFSPNPLALAVVDLTVASSLLALTLTHRLDSCLDFGKLPSSTQ